MAITTSCCLNLPPPSTKSRPSSPPSKPNQLAWTKNEKWRSHCMVGMACMFIGLEMVDLTGTESRAMAETIIIMKSIREQQKGNRWSDKRMCPPWRLNSLETIVPEDLPRPSVRRRWESVGEFRDAPAVVNNNSRKVVIVKRINKGCFSM